GGRRWVGGWRRMDVDGRGIAATLALSVAMTLVFVISAARRSAGRDAAAALKAADRGAIRSGGGRTLSALVVLQLLLATVLLSSSGLLMRGLTRLTDAYAALDPRHVAALRISPAH